jgi:hypothetical protein
MTRGKSLAQTQIEMGGWALGHPSILLPFVFLIRVTLALMSPLAQRAPFIASDPAHTE